jgi:hypothetical protein
MLFHRSKSKKSLPQDFFIGDIPTRPGRRKINLDKPMTSEDKKTSNTRIGEFNMTSGYHPVRPAIMVNTEVETKSKAIPPFNTNHILPVSNNKQRRHRFLHRRHSD